LTLLGDAFGRRFWATLAGDRSGCDSLLKLSMQPIAETYRAALLDILDSQVLVVLADASMELREPDERRALCDGLQQSLPPSAEGPVVALVWQDEAGRMKFLAPPRQERFFQVLRYDQLCAQADRTVTLTPA